MIRGSLGGMRYLVFFYGCTDNKDCRNITFSAAWEDSISQERINDWNRTRRFGRAFLDSENDPVVQYTVNLDFGISVRNFEDTADWWRLTMTWFREFIEES